MSPHKGFFASLRWAKALRCLTAALSLSGLMTLHSNAAGADKAVVDKVADYISRAVARCWAIPVDAAPMITRIQITLNKDGSLAGPPKILDPVTPSPDKVAEAAARAITRCAPFPRLTSYAAHYDLWRDVVLTFNPAQDTSDKPLGVEAKDLDKLLEKYRKKPN